MTGKPQPDSANNPAPAASGGPLQVVVDDCWSRIGVTGDGSCRELERFVHCRNCPTYAAAGGQLLERPASTDYRREWAVHFARQKPASTPGKISVVMFRIGHEWLALPTSTFQEVAELRPVHSIPHRRRGTLLGIVNVRGELLVCISLAAVLGFGQGEKNPRARNTYERLLVAGWEGQRVVFPVDEVYGVHRFDPDQLREPPATLVKSGTSYTRGVLPWQGMLVSSLDAELLFPALTEAIA